MALFIFTTVDQGKEALVNFFYNSTAEEEDHIENHYDAQCDHMMCHRENYFDAPTLIAMEAIEAFRAFCSIGEKS